MVKIKFQKIVLIMGGGEFNQLVIFDIIHELLDGVRQNGVITAMGLDADGNNYLIMYFFYKG